MSLKAVSCSYAHSTTRSSAHERPSDRLALSTAGKNEALLVVRRSEGPAIREKQLAKKGVLSKRSFPHLMCHNLDCHFKMNITPFRDNTRPRCGYQHTATFFQVRPNFLYLCLVGLGMLSYSRHECISL